MIAGLQRDLWSEWQEGVLSELRGDFREVLPAIHLEDVDWETWRPFFEEGCSPRSAVDRALLRDL